MFGFHGRSGAVTPPTPPTWDPTQIQDAIAIWIADAANLTLSGSDVTAWADLSPNARTATPGAAKPTFNPTGINGHGSLLFDNRSSGNPGVGLTFPGTNIYQDGRATSVFIIAKLGSDHSENILLCAELATSDFPLIEYNYSFNGYLFTGYHGDVAPASWLIAPGSAWHALNLTYDATGYLTPTASQLEFNGAAISTGSGITYEDYGTENCIGHYARGGLYQYGLCGEIAVIIIKAAPWAPGELANIEAWATAKYGIAFSMSSSFSAPALPESDQLSISGVSARIKKQRLLATLKNVAIIAAEVVVGAAIAGAAYYAFYQRLGGIL